MKNFIRFEIFAEQNKNKYTDKKNGINYRKKS